MKTVYRYLMITTLFVCYGLTGHCPKASAAEAVLTGKVYDIEGNAVEGAKVFVYNSSEVRRPADFISARTDKAGLYRMVLPAGQYWVIARLKRSEEYGPLFPGDRHSGEAAVIELASVRAMDMDFMVTDLREAMRTRKKEREGTFKITGRVLDEKGSPVRTAYVFANKKEKTAGIPDYLSGWVDEQGCYTLYIPKGKHYLGSAGVFPPAQNYSFRREMTVDGDRSDVDIVIKSDTAIHGEIENP